VNNELVWSKKTKGQGFLGTAPRKVQESVFEAIRDAERSPASNFHSVPVGHGNSLNASLLPKAGDQKKATKCQLCCSMFSTIAAVPAIIGA